MTDKTNEGIIEALSNFGMMIPSDFTLCDDVEVTAGKHAPNCTLTKQAAKDIIRYIDYLREKECFYDEFMDEKPKNILERIDKIVDDYRNRNHEYPTGIALGVREYLELLFANKDAKDPFLCLEEYDGFNIMLIPIKNFLQPVANKKDILRFVLEFDNA